MDAVGLARGRSHATQPRPDQEAREARDRVVNETLAIYFGQQRGTDARRNFLEISVVLAEPPPLVLLSPHNEKRCTRTTDNVNYY